MLLVTSMFLRGVTTLGLPGWRLPVALASHAAGCSRPFGVTGPQRPGRGGCGPLRIGVATGLAPAPDVDCQGCAGGHSAAQTEPAGTACARFDPAALARSPITALTSWRTHLSPFTKGCREWDASMRLPACLRGLGPSTQCPCRTAWQRWVWWTQWGR